MVMINNKKGDSFVLSRRDALLTFPEGHEYQGVEIRAKLDVSLRTFLDLQKIGSDTTPDETAKVFMTFGDVIVQEWNILDEDHSPVPATGQGFLELPPAICTAIIEAWSSQITTAGKA
tara:strand:+ start:619 stop:972 length:354 start_codon:yes stop_codon:yes gene_type:complete